MNDSITQKEVFDFVNKLLAMEDQVEAIMLIGSLTTAYFRFAIPEENFEAILKILTDGIRAIYLKTQEKDYFK